MYSVKLMVTVKEDIPFKEGYEKVAGLIRKFIRENDKELKQKHYSKEFSYYTFDQLSPIEKVYKKGESYLTEIRTTQNEFRDFRGFKGLETDELRLINIIFTPIFYQAKGILKTRTPLFIESKRLNEEGEVKRCQEKLRENIIFRYLKHPKKQSDDLNFIRKNTIKEIRFYPKDITIPFVRKKMDNGDHQLYRCVKAEIEFEDNEIARDVERLIYSSGAGKMTSNGFGFMD